jgi:hypothetical protein
MFGHLSRVATVVGGVCAILVVGEVALGEKSTPLSHDPELRAMQRAPEFARDLSYASYCVKSDCLSDDGKLLDYKIDRPDADANTDASWTVEH